MAGARSYAAGRTALDLDGVLCGFLQSVAGGAIAADVITQSGPGAFDEKRLGGVHYEELELQLGLSLDKLVYDWIAASLKHNFIRRDGSIVATDFNLKAVSEREFFRGLITEVGFPALDGASKDPAYLTVKIAPEYTRFKKGSGKALKSTAGRQKEWLPSNFKLEIDGLDASKVTKIDSFSIKQKVQEDSVGEERVALKEPTQIEFPNLHVTLPAGGADTWTAWFDDFVVKGNNEQGKERNGKLTFLSADLKTPLGIVSFFNLGIFRLEPEPQHAGAEAVARVIAGLYCERMELSVP